MYKPAYDIIIIKSFGEWQTSKAKKQFLTLAPIISIDTADTDSNLLF